MAYRWKPSKSAKREFANNMKDPVFAADYYSRKEARADKRRAGSQFDYSSAGGNYIPTQAQYHFVRANYSLANTPQLRDAFNQIEYGYTCQEKVHHDYIHVVNELIRSNSPL